MHCNSLEQLLSTEGTVFIGTIQKPFDASHAVTTISRRSAAHSSNDLTSAHAVVHQISGA